MDRVHSRHKQMKQPEARSRLWSSTERGRRQRNAQGSRATLDLAAPPCLKSGDPGCQELGRRPKEHPTRTIVTYSQLPPRFRRIMNPSNVLMAIMCRPGESL